MKGELSGKMMTKFAALRRKTYSYLTDDNGESKKAKGIKKYVISQKRNLKKTINIVKKQFDLKMK